jgi:hypothetical protein
LADNQLSIGRIVRFVYEGPKSLGGGQQEAPAIITYVYDDKKAGQCVDLHVFGRPEAAGTSHNAGAFDSHSVPFDDGIIEQTQATLPVRSYRSFSWHWPPR